MFDFFKKKKEEVSVMQLHQDMYRNFSRNQKISAVNLLLGIGLHDDRDDTKRIKEVQYLNVYCKILGIRGDETNAYLERYGIERMIEDLKSLTKEQKDSLVVSAWDMVLLYGKPNEAKVNYTIWIFEKIGVSEDEFTATVEKMMLLMQKFNSIK